MPAAFEVVEALEYDAETDTLTKSERQSWFPERSTNPFPDPSQVNRPRFISSHDRMQERIRELESANQNLTGQRDQLERALEGARLRVEQIKHIHDQRIESLTNAAHRMANDKGYCEEFDEFMVEHSLRPRTWRHTVIVTRTVNVVESTRVEVDIPGNCDDVDQYIREFAENDDTLDWDTDDRGDEDGIEISNHINRVPVYDDGE